MRKKLNLFLQLFVPFVVVTMAVMFLQHIEDTSFLINEVLYLAAPYYDLEGLAKSLVFILSYLGSVLSIWICIFSKSSKLWIGALLIVFLSLCVDLFIQIAVNASGFTKAEYAIALLNARDFDNMLAFSSEIIEASFYSLFFIAILIFLRKRTSFRLGVPWILLIVLSTFGVVYGAAQWVYYIQYPSYPAVVKIPLIVEDYHKNLVDTQPRVLDENIKPNRLLETEKNIIWIIDESIGGKYLSLNGFNKKTTPYLDSIVDTGLISNFGVVNSVANCSALSNLMMRIGMSSHTKGVNVDAAATRNTLPTVFQFAKKAGYKTWLFDAQADKGQFQNFLTPYDLQSIDESRSLNTRTDDHLRDRIFLREIAELLNADHEQKNFIVFVKDGAHWPYLWRYPKESEFFKPVQDTVYEEKTIDNKQKLINTYSNVIRYAVDDFFLNFIKDIDVDRVTTFYTSDHGQNLLDKGANTTLTHCSSSYGMPVSQAEVPLFILGENARERFPVRKDRLYSQYQIFPTILSVMGYGEQVTSRYGDTLLVGQPLSAKRWFYFGYEGGHRMIFKNTK